jgi:hypothetical protein
MVVSVRAKGPALTGSGVRQEEDCKETTVEVSKPIRRCQNRGVITTAGQAPTTPVYGRSGIRHERWPELANEADQRNMGTCNRDVNGEAASGDPTRARVRMRGCRGGTARISDEAPVMGVEQRGSVKGLSSRVNQRWEEPEDSGRGVQLPS